MSRTVSPGFVILVGFLHAAAVAFAGLGGEVSARGAFAARWVVALLYVGSVAWIALRRDIEWPSSVLVGPPLALALGLVSGMIALQFGWGTRPGSPLVILTACALPAVAVAVIAPVLGALARRALAPEETPS